jgi:hypothetical protein
MEGAMPLERIYSAFRKKNFEAGRAYIITGSNHLIEAKVYDTVIINLKSRTLSNEQIIDALLADDISKVNDSPEAVRLEDIQPAVIKNLFRAGAPFILDPEDAAPQRLFSVLKLMGQLSRFDGEGLESFDIIADEILRRYPNFSLERVDVKKRITTFSSDYAISSSFLNTETIPPNSRNIPDWVFNSLIVDDLIFKNLIFYYIFFGELRPPMFRATVKKESGLAAKNGFVRLYRGFYKDMTDNNHVAIFKGSLKAGELTVAWHSDSKAELSVTNADLNKYGLSDGETVNMIFTKK